MTPAMFLVGVLVAVFTIGTVSYALVTAPRHQSDSERRARRHHPSWPHNTPPHPRHRRRP